MKAEMKLSFCHSWIFRALVLSIAVLGLVSCGGGGSGIRESSVCEQGINNSVCSSSLVEDSVWGFGPLETRAELNGVQLDIEISHFYKFYSADQTYEHFIFLKSPSSDEYFTEREYGSILFSNDGQEIELVPIELSCGSEDSIFSIFSESGEKLEIIRHGDSLILNLPANYLDDYLNSINLEVDNIMVELLFILPGYVVLASFFTIFLDMFSPEFLKTIVTGNLCYDLNTLANFQVRYDNRIEGCFSLQGIPRFITN
jgi:hypothetical protein